MKIVMTIYERRAIDGWSYVLGLYLDACMGWIDASVGAWKDGKWRGVAILVLWCSITISLLMAHSRLLRSLIVRLILWLSSPCFQSSVTIFSIWTCLVRDWCQLYCDTMEIGLLHNLNPTPVRLYIRRTVSRLYLYHFCDPLLLVLRQQCRFEEMCCRSTTGTNVVPSLCSLLFSTSGLGRDANTHVETPHLYAHHLISLILFYFSSLFPIIIVLTT